MRTTALGVARHLWILVFAFLVVCAIPAHAAPDACLRLSLSSDGTQAERAKEIEATIAKAEESNRPANILVRDASIVPQLRRRLPSNALLLVQRSESFNEVALSNLAKQLPPRSKVAIVHAVPENLEQARQIHGVAVNKSGTTNVELARYRKTLQTLLKEHELQSVLDLGRETSSSKPMRDQAIDLINSRTRDDITVFLGHVRSGEMVFSDGTSLPLGDLADLTVDGGHGQFWAIGCNTLTYSKTGSIPVMATGRRINYNEAFSILRSFLEGSKVGRSYRDFFLGLHKRPGAEAAIGLVGTLIVFQPIARRSGQ